MSAERLREIEEVAQALEELVREYSYQWGKSLVTDDLRAAGPAEDVYLRLEDERILDESVNLCRLVRDIVTWATLRRS